GFKGVAAMGSQREIITSEEGVKDIKRAMEWAQEAGIPVVITGEGVVPEGMTIKTALDIIKKRFEELLEVAERCKVYLAIEDHGTISLTPDGLPTLMGLVDSKWLGVNFDTANIHRGNYIGTDSSGYKWRIGKVESYSEVELIKKIANKVRHVHFKDVIGLEPVILGQGEIDLIGCMKALKEVGSDAVLAYETEGCEDKEKAYQMIVESKKWVENALKNL
ncbi:MAG: sugar phosphate isomerase/epimerase family protein, partial [Actinomycetota bacterium]